MEFFTIFILLFSFQTQISGKSNRRRTQPNDVDINDPNWVQDGNGPGKYAPEDMDLGRRRRTQSISGKPVDTYFDPDWGFRRGYGYKSKDDVLKDLADSDNMGQGRRRRTKYISDKSYRRRAQPADGHLIDPFWGAVPEGNVQDKWGRENMDWGIPRRTQSISGKNYRRRTQPADGHIIDPFWGAVPEGKVQDNWPWENKAWGRRTKSVSRRRN